LIPTRQIFHIDLTYVVPAANPATHPIFDPVDIDILDYDGRLYAYKIFHLGSTMTDEYLATIGEQTLTLRNPQDLRRLLATLDQQFASPPSVRLFDQTESYQVNLFTQVNTVE
jgi:hypothetical protein